MNKKPRKKAKSAIATIRAIINDEINLAELVVVEFRTEADFAQHNANATDVESRKTDLLVDRDYYIRLANAATVKLQKLHILRDLFVSFAAEFAREIPNR